MNSGLGSLNLAIPPDMASILDPAGQGVAGNVMALYNITANNMNTAQCSVMIQVTLQNAGPGNIFISGFSSSTGFSGSGSLTLDVLLFPANPAVLIH